MFVTSITFTVIFLNFTTMSTITATVVVTVCSDLPYMLVIAPLDSTFKIVTKQFIELTWA